MYSEQHSGEGTPKGKIFTDAYIEELLNAYSRTIIRLCYTYVKNMSDAEDIAQEVFLTLLKREKPFDSPEHEKAWLLRTAMNKSKNLLRSGRVSKTVYLDANENKAAINDKEQSQALERNEVREAVLSLPEKYRTVIHLFYYDGYSIKEIAGIINKKTATVGTLLSRGRERLKGILTEDVVEF
jgi:RNA polymerase sigma-70 factor (ECF subfamily)